MKILSIKKLSCGFCLKEQDLQDGKAKGVSGKDGFICVDCLRMATKILEDSRKLENPEQGV